MCDQAERERWIRLGRAIGLWEGEGHVGRSRRPTEASPFYVQASARATSTDRDVIEWMVEEFGGKIYGPYASVTALGKKPIFVWQIGSWPLFESFYATVRPYIGQRRAAALDALMEYRKTMPKRRVPGCVAPNIPSRAGMAYHYNRKQTPCDNCRAAFYLWRNLHRAEIRRYSRESARRRRAKNPINHRAASRKWYEENRDAYNASRRTRRNAPSS